MEATDIINLILSFIYKWLGTTIPRILTAFFGMVCTFLSVVGLWDRRLKTASGAIGILFGLLMVVIALQPELIYFFAKMSYFTRVRILMVILSAIVIIIAIESIRRSHLQERYAILWITTSLVILIIAFFPKVVNILEFILGTEYVTSVIAIVFTFLLLIAFHFSISLSAYRKNQTQIAQRCALLEERIHELTKRLDVLPSDEQNDQDKREAFIGIAQKKETEPETAIKQAGFRTLRGSQVAMPIIIAGIALAALVIGWLTPAPMVGDEITHFYMLSKQSENLSKPNFYAHIPTGWGESEVRRYPHTFLWHYLGAMFYRLTGNNFYIVQLYQILFWVQLLIAAYLLAKERNGVENRSALLYLVLLASLPVAIIFSVIFYQDVPMAAQVLTSFYFLRKRRWAISALFMCLAIGFKITAMLFLPAYFICLFYWETQWRGWLKALFNLSMAAMILFIFTFVTGKIIKEYAEAEFYPEKKIDQLLGQVKHFKGIKIELQKESGLQNEKIKLVTPYEVEIIANHPGDLRILENYFVYGGMILWVVVLAGVVSFFCSRLGLGCDLKSGGSVIWLLGVGLSYTIFAAVFLKTAPDARFFLPGIIFMILPFVEQTVRLPKPKLIITVISALAILQGGYVLAKTYKLRHVTPEVQAAIEYLKKNQPSPRTVFMYPEGNYRLFPVPHEWYLNYKLREFWFSDNDERIRMLNHFGTGAIVIKKHLIAEVDPEIINLGVYPSFFVRDIQADARFEKVFENDGVVIFKVPPVLDKEKPKLKMNVSN